MRDVAVVAYPDPRLHEVAVAFIIRVAEGSNLTEQAVLDHVKGRIASFKIPDRFLKFPEGQMGLKPLRAELADLASR